MLTVTSHSLETEFTRPAKPVQDHTLSCICCLTDVKLSNSVLLERLSSYHKHLEPSLKKKRKLPKSGLYKSSLSDPSSPVISSPLYTSRKSPFEKNFVVNTPLHKKVK